MGDLSPDLKRITSKVSQQQSSFSTKKWVQNSAIFAIFTIGLIIRLYDLTDPPLDFHETRQLGSALIARGMYYQMDPTTPEEKRDLAIDLWQSAPVYEPQILERIVATTYMLVGAEHLWIARIYSSLFWVLGAVAVYSLAKELGSVNGAMIASAIYLFLPYGIIASRSFQPDPLMVSLMVWAIWALYRWSSQPTWGRTILAGVLCGFAILIKPVAIFPLLSAGVGVVLISLKIRHIIFNKQIWVISLFSALPAGIYYLILSKTQASGLVGSFVFSFQNLLLQPYVYVRWIEKINAIIGIGTFVACLLGVIVMERLKDKAITIGLWVGYILFGLAFPYHFLTHDYYHLMIIPIAALCISPLVRIIFLQIAKQPPIWRIMALVILLFAAGFQLWNARADLARVDYRAEVDGWKRLGRELPQDGTILAITQSYGFRLQYYSWIRVQYWPSQADIRMMELAGDFSFDYEKEFAERVQGIDYFLVTNFSEFEGQPELKSILYERDPNPTRGYAHLIFDLTQNNLP
ncbi:MAG: hypothetical protein A2Z14_13840 [Chloroflexi bacterium RBG_16_48_8]|nr:MAG: hypothetical protein A2Z14_13840 [Chloroflexi bacterium RBG_16_48_8]